MADRDPHSQEQNETDVPASPPQDYHSVLTKLIGEVSKDHTRLRGLVYAIARQNLKPEAAPAHPAEDAQKANTVSQHTQAQELERAIERVEADMARAWQDPPSRPEHTPTEQGDMAENTSSSPDDEILSNRQPPASNSVVMLSEEPRQWPERSDRTYLTRAPTWLDPGIRASLDVVDYVPVDLPQARQAKVGSFLQLVAASIIGVILYIGVTGWIYMNRQPGAGAVLVGAPPPQAAATAAKDLAGAAQSQPQQPLPEPQPILPFPLPRSYGVYAGSNGQLVPLEQLPIKVPIARVMVSAEITQPSKATVAGNKLAFVVFRRDLVASAPQSVSVRVVARVTRAMNFVEGKPTVAPVEASWRIRDKAYEFQVSPIESNREMIVIQPDPSFVFPAGRYALVLSGFGYDFTVAGPVTAPEQCLEQTQVMDGIVVTECPKNREERQPARPGRP